MPDFDLWDDENAYKPKLELTTRRAQMEDIMAERAPRAWLQGRPGTEPELTKEEAERRRRALQAEMERHDAMLLEPGEDALRQRLHLGPRFLTGDERTD